MPCPTLSVEKVLDVVLNALATRLSQGPFVSIHKILLELTAGFGLLPVRTRSAFDALGEALDQGVIPKEAAVAAVEKVVGAFSEIIGGVLQLLCGVRGFARDRLAEICDDLACILRLRGPGCTNQQANYRGNYYQLLKFNFLFLPCFLK